MPLSTVRKAGVDSGPEIRVIGLTGGMGAGKSVVAGIIRSLGHPVYDADAAAKRLYDVDRELLVAVVDRFGAAVVDASGVLDRRRLADVVFSDQEALEALNALVHPAVGRDFDRWRNRCGSSGFRIVFREAAILFESGADRDCDVVWGVSAPRNLRVERVRQRSGWSEEDVLQRMARQWTEEEVLSRCHATLVNDGQHPLIPQVLELIGRL